MATTTEWKVDKTGWIPGPWMSEPDHLEFEHAGYPAQIRRSNSGGNWCGYVGVPPGHPWHGQDMFAVDASVHGGITYSRPCVEGGICHEPKPGEPDNVWWLGFDCAHSGDYSPGFSKLAGTISDPSLWLPNGYSTYKCVDYVLYETKRLAEQAKAATEPKPPEDE